MFENLFKIPYLLLAITTLLIGGCSSVEEKSAGAETALKSVESSAPIDDAKNPSQREDSKTATTQAEEPLESKKSNVEVIEASVVEQQELKLEPISDQAGQKPTPGDGTTGKTPGLSDQPQQDVQVAIAKPAVSQPLTADVTGKDVPVSTGPDHFVITVFKKDPDHPKFGKGHEMGFLINDVPGGEVVIERGKSYRFEVATDPKHDVYISKKDIGWGASPLSKGVQGAYIYKGIMTLSPDDSTPSEIYYSCRNHPYMGGKIHVVNPGESVEISTTQKKSATSGASAVPATQANITVSMVNQKLMFADMLLKGAGARRVNSSTNTDAKAMQQKAGQLVLDAKGQLKQGDKQTAYNNAEEALALMREAAKLVPDGDQVEILKEQHKELLTSLSNFEKSHQDSYKRVKKSGGDAIMYDQNQVNTLRDQAVALAGKGDYSNANQNLQKAQRMVTVAIQKMLDSQTIVYDLNFESAQEEYEYELKRFGGYEELIPIAVQEKNPSEGAKKLMETYLTKGQNMRDSAIAKADAGGYAAAIPMLQNATKEVRRALRMVGVMQ